MAAKAASSTCSKSVLAASLLVAALSLHGCLADVPRHSLAAWRAKPNFLVSFEYIPPGKAGSAAQLNSCSVAGVAPAVQCSGHGVCKSWGNYVAGQPPRLSFCECSVGWADPECRTPRKSQQTAYLLSLFLGPIGVDQLYLGKLSNAFMKLVTLGGLGFWYAFDVVSIGSGPVYTATQYRVAHDLPHYAFVLTAVSFVIVLGFIVSFISALQQRSQRRKEAMMFQNEEEHLKYNGRRSENSKPRSLAPGLPGITPFSGQPNELGAPMRDMMPAYRAAGPLSRNFAPAFPGYGATMGGHAPMSMQSMPPQGMPPPVVPLTVMPGSMAPGAVIQTLPSSQLMQSVPVGMPPMLPLQAPASSMQMMLPPAAPFDSVSAGVPPRAAAGQATPTSIRSLSPPQFRVPSPPMMATSLPAAATRRLPQQVGSSARSLSPMAASARSISPAQLVARPMMATSLPAAATGRLPQRVGSSVRSLSPVAASSQSISTAQSVAPFLGAATLPATATGVLQRPSAMRSLPVGSSAARLRSRSPDGVLNPPAGTRMLSADRVTNIRAQ